MARKFSSTALVPLGGRALVLADAHPGEPDGVAAKLAAALLRVVSDVPTSQQHASPTPAEAARHTARAAATRAATAAGTLALPPGPLGWLTILPEMLAVWRVQAQMVSDIAALYGRQGKLTEEQMLYCLFKHAASQAVRDLVVRVGERVIVKRAASGALQRIAKHVGLSLTQRMVSKTVSRWLPVIGAMGVAAYAYRDTVQVAKAAIELFEQNDMRDMR